MKKLVFVSIAIIMGFTFADISVSFAEEKAGKSIFEYKKELSITDKQEKNLRDILAKLQSYLTDKQKELNGLRAELSKMIAESADLDKIKDKLNNIAKIQADASYEDIASTRAIETELTGTQLTKWRNMQAEFARNLQQAQESASKTKEIKK
jgi:Skp family chaperone for outer membrane proteins